MHNLFFVFTKFHVFLHVVSCRYALVRYTSALVPARVIDSAEIAKKRFDKSVDCLLDANRITTTEADKAIVQFSTLASLNFKQHLQVFNEKDHRLDTFYANLLGTDPQFKELWKVVRVRDYPVYW